MMSNLVTGYQSCTLACTMAALYAQPEVDVEVGPLTVVCRERGQRKLAQAGLQHLKIQVHVNDDG